MQSILLLRASFLLAIIHYKPTWTKTTKFQVTSLPEILRILQFWYCVGINYRPAISDFDFARFLSEFLSNSSKILLSSDKTAHDLLFFEPKFKTKSKVETVETGFISYKIPDESSLFNEIS